MSILPSAKAPLRRRTRSAWGCPPLWLCGPHVWCLVLAFAGAACDDERLPELTPREAPSPKRAVNGAAPTEKAPLPPAKTFDDLDVKEAEKKNDEPQFRDDDYREPLPDDLKPHLFDPNQPPPLGARERKKSGKTAGSPNELPPRLLDNEAFQEQLREAEKILKDRGALDSTDKRQR